MNDRRYWRENVPKRTVPEGPGRRIALLSRTTPDLRLSLERAASVSGRSLGQEVEHRLERSFADENMLVQIFGDPDRARRHNTFAVASKEVEAEVGEVAPDDGDAMLQRNLLEAETAVCVAKKYRNNAAISVGEQDRQGICLKAIDLAKKAIRRADRGLFLERYPGEEQSFDPRVNEAVAHDDLLRTKQGRRSKNKP